MIWSSENDEKKALDMSSSHLSHSGHLEHPGNTLTRQATSTSVAKADIRNSQLYQRIIGQSYQQVGLGPHGEAPESTRVNAKSDGQTPHLVPPKDSEEDRPASGGFHLEGLSEEANQSLMRQITEIAATASAIATRDATTKGPHKAAQLAHTPAKKHAERPSNANTRTPTYVGEPEEPPPGHTSGGHDAPNWSRTKSAVILLTATVAYAIIAEILVSTVDAVLEGSEIDEKFLGITLFALVPNTTEFLVSTVITMEL